MARYVCIGRRETGKSHLARILVDRLLREDQRRRALVWVVQPEAHYPGVELRSVQSAASHMTERRWVFRPPVTVREVAQLAKRLREACPARELVLVIDELADGQVTTAGPSPDWRCDELRECLQTIRGIHLVGTTQRPASMPLSLRELADEYFMFSTTGEAAYTRLKRDGVPAHKLEALSALKQDRRYLVYHVGKE
jgi:hypothetical protein